MDFHGVKLQLVELPSFFPGFSDGDKGPTYMSIARSADLIAIILDGTKNCLEDLKTIEEEFENSSVKLKKIKSQDKEARKVLIVVNKVLKNFKSEYPVCWVEDFKDAVWRMLDLIYVYTKQPGKEKEHPPVALPKGSNLEYLASAVHKDFVKKFKFARVWGKSAKHQGSNVSL